jgi:hypothetical protein
MLTDTLLEVNTILHCLHKKNEGYVKFSFARYPIDGYFK